jgi:hypothetical protein
MAQKESEQVQNPLLFRQKEALATAAPLYYTNNTAFLPSFRHKGWSCWNNRAHELRAWRPGQLCVDMCTGQFGPTRARVRHGLLTRAYFHTIGVDPSIPTTRPGPFCLSKGHCTRPVYPILSSGLLPQV